jgi:hypothetical protein
MVFEAECFAASSRTAVERADSFEASEEVDVDFDVTHGDSRMILVALAEATFR